MLSRCAQFAQFARFARRAAAGKSLDVAGGRRTMFADKCAFSKASDDVPKVSEDARLICKRLEDDTTRMCKRLEGIYVCLWSISAASTIALVKYVFW